MNQFIYHIREVLIANGKKRVKEMKFCGYHNRNGEFIVTSMIARYYTVKNEEKGNAA